MIGLVLVKLAPFGLNKGDFAQHVVHCMDHHSVGNFPLLPLTGNVQPMHVAGAAPIFTQRNRLDPGK